MISELPANAQVFFLIFARVLALVETAPLLSSESVPQIAKVALAFFASFLVFPWVQAAGYPIPELGLDYALLALGEALIGVLIGFFLILVYSVFQLAGQFYSLQMGFGASEVFDPLAQIEIPIVGQFLNLVAMLIFLLVGGFQKVFLTGVYRSFEAMRAVDLVIYRNDIIRMTLLGMTRLFEQSLVISFPILGILFLVSVTTGLLAKASPQMNLLTLGFPISIGTAFIVLFLMLPILAETFSAIIDYGFAELLRLFSSIWELRT
ncbi:MAG: flagellar biosynthetic protein FliR [Spirochaetales bacterium]|jgi:flagellar biosynthetic protein FliR|nr:flagellar biosynthetic protein FliR [Spirochaetales bacterium]